MFVFIITDDKNLKRKYFMLVLSGTLLFMALLFRMSLKTVCTAKLFHIF